MKHLYIILALVFIIGCKNNLDYNSKLSERIEILDKDYKLYSNNLVHKYVLNEVKTKPFYERAVYIRKVIDAQIIEINNTNTFENRIYNNLNNCFDTILSFYWSKDKDEFLSMYEKILVFNNDYKNGEKLKAKLFLLYDLKLIRNEITRYLYSQIDKYDYKFNLIRPVVLENNNELKLGETYKAKILLFAVDTTSPPMYFINGDTIVTWNGYGIYNIKTSEKGNFEWRGTMKYFNNETGAFEEFPISDSYIVK